MFEFGSIGLARFPFTDLSGDKRRLVLVISRNNESRSDVIVCFITSVPRTGLDMATIDATVETGLKVRSVVRFDKIATLKKSMITGRLGCASLSWLEGHAATFLGVFGSGDFLLDSD